MTETKPKSEKEKYKVLTPMFRVSFPQVFTPKAGDNPGDKPKYSVTMIFQTAETEKSKAAGVGVVSIEELKTAVRNVLLDKFGQDWKAKAGNIRLPFRNGTEKTYDGFGPGIIFCSASSLGKPGLVDQERKDIIDPNKFYAGCYARATVNAYWYDRKGNKGVALGLQNIQFWKDGEPFSSKANPEKDFDAIPVPAGAAGAAAGQSSVGGGGGGDDMGV